MGLLVGQTPQLMIVRKGSCAVPFQAWRAAAFLRFPAIPLMGFFSTAPRPQPAPLYRAILFDVNETLLDMRPLKRALVKAFGN
jgi:hypothetical protein